MRLSRENSEGLETESRANLQGGTQVARITGRTIILSWSRYRAGELGSGVQMCSLSLGASV